jgi:hypothetical protein
MSDGPPKLAQLNLLVEDMSASLDFYRRLGAVSPENGPHVELNLPVLEAVTRAPFGIKEKNGCGGSG